MDNLHPEIRKAKSSDVATIASMLGYMAPMIGAQPDRQRASQFVRTSMSSNAARVLVCDGGVLIAVESQNLWTERRHTQICALWSESVDVMRALVSACAEWFETRRGSILMCYMFPAETLADEALRDSGFELSGSMLVRRRYGSVG